MKNKTLNALGLVLAMTMAAPAAAFAQTEGTAPAPAEAQREVDLDRVKERAAEAIERRQKTIERLLFEIGANDHVTSERAAQLNDELAASSSGLTALGEEIAAAGTSEELRVLVPKIAEDYRIYLVMAPKTAETLASDTIVGASERFDDVESRINEAIARAEDAGYDVGEAQSHLDEMIGLVEQGVALADPVAESVLPLQPADWPDPAEGILRQGRDDLTDARQLMRQARDAARDAVRALREAIGGGETST